jgi:hypothetical protein
VRNILGGQEMSWRVRDERDWQGGAILLSLLHSFKEVKYADSDNRVART